ncbi:transposon Ty3-I Gag-Pol polyprotein [Trichonephila clavipes]|nr:transposon Ty3-I Gag-Pol polyprotein [Trichonephila clavipes]
MTIIDLKNIIIGSKDYEEGFVRAQLSVILEERLERESEEKIQQQREFELEKMRLEIERSRFNSENLSPLKTSVSDLIKIIPNFDIRDGDIVLFLTMFERQAKRIGVEKTNWVSALLARMPPDITQLIAREPEDKFDNYDYIKGVLLKRFKMSPETFRQKFMKHQRIPARSWRDFVFEITSYFEEWLDGMEAVIDTGAQISVVRADVVEGQSVDSGGTIQIMSAFGEREVTELKIFNLKIDDSRHGVVPIMCAVSKRLVNDMLVCSSAYEALLENARVQFIHNPTNSYVSSRAVEGITADDPKSISSQEITRETYPSEIYIQSVSKANEEEQLPEGRETRSTFIKMQREDDTLKKLWSLAEKQKNSVKIHNGILVHSEYICGENIDQVVLPQCKREEVLKMAHDVPLGGHLGEQKTRQRIKYSFYWPTIKQDVKRFCESCKICQFRKPFTYRDRVPIQPLVRPEIPFGVWTVLGRWNLLRGGTIILLFAQLIYARDGQRPYLSRK